MNKELYALQALEDLSTIIEVELPKERLDGCKRRIMEIENALKAFEIIKKLLSISVIQTAQETHYWASINDELTKKEYDLLKEELL